MDIWHISSAKLQVLCTAMQGFDVAFVLNCSDFTVFVQACFGHTEGAAGLTGLLTAMSQLADCQLPGIMCLRNINPYVSAALSEWDQSSSSSLFAPRQAAAAVSCSETTLAGMLPDQFSFLQESIHNTLLYISLPILK